MNFVNVNRPVHLLALSACALIALTGCERAREGFDTGFKESFKKEFIASCVKPASGTGTSVVMATKLCTCVVDSIMKDATVSELRDDKVIDQKGNAAVAQCRKDIVGLAPAVMSPTS